MSDIKQIIINPLIKKLMNNQQLAALGLHTLPNIPAAALACPHFAERLDGYKQAYYNKKAAQIPNALEPILATLGASADLYMDIRAQRRNNSEEVELYYCEHYMPLLISLNGLTLQLRYDNKGKAYFYPLFQTINQLDRSLTYEQKSAATAHLKEPNKIGTFTAKKLRAWFDYCAAYLAALTEAAEASKDQEAENRASIAAHIASLGPLARTTHTHQSEPRWYIDTPHFATVLELQGKGTYISNHTTYRGTLADIARLERTLAAAEALVAHLRTYDNGKHLNNKPGEDLINALLNK